MSIFGKALSIVLSFSKIDVLDNIDYMYLGGIANCHVPPPMRKAWNTR